MKKAILIFLIFLISFPLAYAGKKKSKPDFYEWSKTSGVLQNHHLQKGKLYLDYENMQVEMEFINDGSIHIALHYGERIVPAHSYSVVQTAVREDAELKQGTDALRFSLGDISCRIFKERFSLEFLYKGQRSFYSDVYYVPALYTKDRDSFYLRPEVRDDVFVGLGSKHTNFVLNGHKFEMNNIDNYPNYSSFPFYISINERLPYGLFVDSPALSVFSMGKMDRRFKGRFTFQDQKDQDKFKYRVEIEGNRVDLYYFPGNTKQILRELTTLTGKPYLPPLWALGYHQCRYSYMSDNAIDRVVTGFEQNNMPIESIWMDIHYMDEYRSFTFDPKRYPDVKGMSKKLSQKGIKLAAIIDPGIKQDNSYWVYKQLHGKKLYIKHQKEAYVGKVWPGESIYPDYSNPKARQWWGDLYKFQIENGIQGHWIDMNEPADFSGKKTIPHDTLQHYEGLKAHNREIHNIYGLTMAMATHEGIKRWNKGDRVFLLTRSAFPGSQRYAFQWTGDNVAEWKHIRQDLYRILGLGVSGMPWVGADIGGFHGSPEEELFTRWIQIGAFYPFMRNHSAVGSKYQEPFAKYFPNNRDIHQKYLELRYKLLPYIYSQVYLTHRTGLPLMRPMLLSYGADYIRINDQFMLGDDLLIAPVLDKGAGSVPVSLPGNRWTEWWTGKQYHSGKHKVKVSIQDIPFFVRDGSIIPTYGFKMMNTAGLTNGADITLLIFPDKKGRAETVLYEDDGISYEYEQRQYLITKIHYQESDNVARIILEHKGDWNPQRKLIFKFNKNIRRAVINEKKTEVFDQTAVY